MGNRVAKKGDFKQEIFNEVNENVRALERLFPSVVKDGQVDFEALKEELGQFKEVGPEKYGLTWSGKQNAKKVAQEDIVGITLKFIPEDSKNPDTTENLYIEGDNLEILKLLRQNYYGAIKMIYIDPPYNTGNDFVYNDNFNIDKNESDIAEGDISELGERYTINSKSTNKYHAKWLNMMYPRLKVAKDLLVDDGVILIHLDEHEFVNCNKIIEEIFGEENNLGEIVWDKRNPKGDAKGIACQHEYIIVYSKNKEELVKKNNIKRPKKNAKTILEKSNFYWRMYRKGEISFEEMNSQFNKWISKQSSFSGGEKAYNAIDDRGEVYQAVSMAWPNKKKAPDQYFIPLIHPITGIKCPVPDKGWRNPPETMKQLLDEDRIIFGRDETSQPRRKYLLKENMYENVPSLIYYGGSDDRLLNMLEIPFDNPKVVDVSSELIKIFTGSNDTILDFFGGSSTTAHAVMQLNVEDGGNRKFIMVQLLELSDEKSEAYKSGYKNICEIGKERIRRAGEKIKKENKDKERIENLDIGFKVFRAGNTNIRWNYESANLQTLKAYTDVQLDEQRNSFDYIAASKQMTMEEGTLSPKDALDFMPGFKDIDVVYEILLRQRDIPLSAKVELLEDIGKRTYIFADSYLVCLEESITNELIEKIAAINPLPIKFVFRDSAFEDNIALKDEVIRRLNALIERNTGEDKKSYTVEFI